MSQRFELFVEGKPESQGSMRIYNGRIVHSAGRGLRAWRDKIANQVNEALLAIQQPVWDGPVTLDLTFYLPMTSKTQVDRAAHIKRPDLDKLARAVLDALTQAGLYIDDCQVSSLRLQKKYGLTPGVQIEALC